MGPVGRLQFSELLWGCCGGARPWRMTVVNVEAANVEGRRLLSCLEPGQFSQSVLQNPEALYEGATRGIFAFLLLLPCLEGAWAAVQRG